MTTNNPYDDPRYGGYEPHYPVSDTPATNPDAPAAGADAYAPAPDAYAPAPDAYGGAPEAYHPAPYPPYGYDPRYAGYGGYPYYGAPTPPPAPKPTHRGRWTLGAGIATLVAAALVGGIAIGHTGSNTVAGSGSGIGSGSGEGSGSGSSGGLGNGSGGGIVLPGGGLGNGSGGGLGSGSGTSQSAALATGKQQKGIVTVVSVLQYQTAESAGTGMILTSDGEILTNNHVVNGATSITVTVASSGKSYRADVVGTDPTDDVAVLQLRNASGLTKANVGESSDVKVGDSVVGVGNAGGTGTLRASSGKVTDLNQSITATDESGQNGEKLTGLIEVNAPIISGDSGGPLYDSSGDIVGMDTAASTGADQSTATTAYAIPIGNAVSLAKQIEKKVETSKIHIGLPPFLGVGLTANTQSATVEELLQGPAASAGITVGSTITGVSGHSVTTQASLKTVLRNYQPGDHVSVTWTDAQGQSHTAGLTLATGPAD